MKTQHHHHPKNQPTHLITTLAMVIFGLMITPQLSAQQDQPRFELIDLLSSGDSNYRLAFPYGLNNLGSVGGEVWDEELQRFWPCIWEGPHLRLLDVEGIPEGFSANVVDLNDHNFIAGSARSDFRGDTYAVSWEDPEAAAMVLPPLVPEMSFASKVNEDDYIAGSSWNSNGYFSGVVWHQGAIVRELKPLPGFGESLARDINNHGEVVGSSDDRSFPVTATLWTVDGSFRLPPLPEHSRGHAYAINDHGLVAGISRTSWEETTLVIWDRQRVPHRLSTPDTAVVYWVSGINNHNQVICLGWNIGHQGDSVPIYWSDGEGFILANLVEDLDPQITLFYLGGINNAGVISASGVDEGMNTGRPYVLMPLHLVLDNPTPGIAGQINRISVSGCTPGAKLFFAFSLEPGLTILPTINTKCGGKGLSLKNLQFVGSATADNQGNAIFAHYIPPALARQEIYIQVIEKESCKLSNRIEPILK